MTSAITYQFSPSTSALSTGAMHDEGRPKDPPKGLIATTAVQTLNGWVGQVVVDGEVVWEVVITPTGSSSDDKNAAIQAANAQVHERVRSLFAPSTPGV